ncbi:MAG: autotransporter assembly complex family protein [Rhodomicrobiaceae bacterium]
MFKARLALATALLAGVSLTAEKAAAQDVLGSIVEPIRELWAGKKNELPYEVELTVSGDDSGLVDALENVSALEAQSDQGAAGMDSLLALARAEPATLTAALYGRGYYSGRIEVRVAGQLIDDTATEINPPEQRPVPVTISVEPGPLFTFGSITISYTGDDRPDETDDAIAEEAGLVAGGPARSGAILATTRRLVAAWKKRSYAFAKIVSQDVTADHTERTVDVAFVVDPGRPVAFGPVEVKGSERFEAELLRSRADIPEGEPYSPKTLQDARKRIAKLDGVGSVRVIENDTPDADGRIPLTLEVTERKARFIGANAAVSSVDGAELGAYWGHRNVFGGGESLRLDATLSNLGGNALKDLEYETKLSLIWPSLASPYTDYKASLLVKHEEPDSYESDEATFSAGAIHQFSDTLTGEIAGKTSWIETEDIFGASEFFLLSVPGQLIYDTRDNPLDATEGWRAALSAEPAADLRNENAFIHSYAQFSTYARIGETPHIVAAGRIGAGTVAGAGIDDVPAPVRFLGGGGSVRGYAFRSIGPEFAGEAVGGLSIVEVSGELRIKVTDTIGVVPFVDAAFVTGGSFFEGEGETAVGAGLGLRYHTSIGPIRLDVATPLDRPDGEPEIVFYVGLGQSF